MRDKVDHKDLQRRLKEDEVAVFLQEFIANAKDFYENYGRLIGVGIIAIALAAAAAYLWQQKNATDFNESQILFSTATANIENEDYAEAVKNLDLVIQNYSGTPLATSAKLLRGDCYFHLEQYQMSENDYLDIIPALSKADALPVRIALVQTYRSQDKFDAAIQELETLEQSLSTTIAKEQIVFLQAKCYEDKNDSAKALERYKSIPSTSNFYRIAGERIAWLEAEPAGAIDS